MAEQGPETTFERVERLIKERMKKFSKTPYAVPAALALTAGFYYFTVTVLSGTCLSNILPPLFMLGMFWMVDVKDVKRLIILGIVGGLVCGAVQAAVYVDYFSNLDTQQAESDNGVLTGYVSPYRGDTSMTYNFTAIMHVNQSVVFDDINLSVVGFTGNVLSAYDFTVDNLTMTLLTRDDTQAVYSAQATVSHAINYYYFSTNMTTGTGVEYTSTGATGPLAQSASALVAPLTTTSYMVIMLQLFPIYAIIVFMIWWTRRARKFREKALEKWETERKQTEKDISKAAQDEKKAADLRKAMGLEDGGGDSFVCSECGADVPADAAECPKCGEKFDADKDEGPKEEAEEKTPAKAKASRSDEDTFVCSECGADVPGDATKCPKCGEKFD